MFYVMSQHDARQRFFVLVIFRPRSLHSQWSMSSEFVMLPKIINILKWSGYLQISEVSKYFNAYQKSQHIFLDKCVHIWNLEHWCLVALLPKHHLTFAVYETLFLLMIVFRYFFNGNLSIPENPNIMSGWEDGEDGYYLQQLLSLNFAKRSTFKSKHINNISDRFCLTELSCFSYKLLVIYTL